MCEFFYQGLGSSVALNFSRKYGAMDTFSPHQLTAEKKLGGTSGMLGLSRRDVVLTEDNKQAHGIGKTLQQFENMVKQSSRTLLVLE